MNKLKGKSKTTALVLSFITSANLFYVGAWGTSVLRIFMVMMLGMGDPALNRVLGPALVTLFFLDFMLLLTMSEEEFERKYGQGTTPFHSIIWSSLSDYFRSAPAGRSWRADVLKAKEWYEKKEYIIALGELLPLRGTRAEEHREFWSTIISCMIYTNRREEALELVRQAVARGMKPEGHSEIGGMIAKVVEEETQRKRESARILLESAYGKNYAKSAAAQPEQVKNAEIA